MCQLVQEWQIIYGDYQLLFWLDVMPNSQEGMAIWYGKLVKSPWLGGHRLWWEIYCCCITKWVWCAFKVSSNITTFMQLSVLLWEASFSRELWWLQELLIGDISQISSYKWDIYIISRRLWKYNGRSRKKNKSNKKGLSSVEHGLLERHDYCTNSSYDWLPGKDWACGGKGEPHGTSTPWGFLCTHSRWRNGLSSGTGNGKVATLCEQALTCAPIDKFYIRSHQNRKRHQSTRWPTQKMEKD